MNCANNASDDLSSLIMKALPHALFAEASQSFRVAGSSGEEVLTTLSYAVSIRETSEDGWLLSSTLRDKDTKISLGTCRTNNSQDWQLVSPVCSTRFNSMVAFVMVAVTLSLITLWTILGNLLVLVALCRFATLRTMSNCLIGNLAISDLLLALTVLPIATGHDLLGYWVFGETTCTVWLCIDVLYCTASIWGLCTVAFDRYLATVYPVWYHDQRSVRKAIACVVFVWIFSIVISFAPFIGWQHMIPNFFSFNTNIQRYECILFTSSSYVLYSSMGSFIIPGILMTFMYIRIFIVLHSQSTGLKKKASVTSMSPVYAGNGCPIIHEPSSEGLNCLGRDTTTTTMLSVTAESSSNLDDAEEADIRVDTDRLLHLTKVDPASNCSSTFRQETEREMGAITSAGVQLKTTLIPASKRSNSFAVPTASQAGSKHLLSVIDMDRRNSHNMAIPRSTSDMGNINSNMHELRLSTACHRSKSANALSTGDEGESYRTPPIPRRSLPCNITVFSRNSRMTMSMKRRFELREQRATKRMLLIMACFCVCWVPFLFVYILRSVCTTCAMNQHFVAAIIWLGYVNSSLNPVLYTLFNDDFKGAFKKLMGFRSPAIKRKKRIRR